MVPVSGEVFFPAAGYPFTRKLARWIDPFTAPKTRTSCATWAKGDLPFGGGYKVCVGWKTEFNYMYTTAHLRVVTADRQDIKKAVNDCLLAAGVAAALSAIATKGAAALPAFEATIKACLVAKLPTLMSVQVYTNSGWGGWQ